jgi:hypothetical protein
LRYVIYIEIYLEIYLECIDIYLEICLVAFEIYIPRPAMETTSSIPPSLSSRWAAQNAEGITQVASNAGTRRTMASAISADKRPERYFPT